MSVKVPKDKINKTTMLDSFRIIATILVVAIHTSPLSSISEDADFFVTRVLARIAVPFFFMITGHYVLGKNMYCRENSKFEQRYFLQNLKSKTTGAEALKRTVKKQP